MDIYTAEHEALNLHIQLYGSSASSYQTAIPGDGSLIVTLKAQDGQLFEYHVRETTRRGVFSCSEPKLVGQAVPNVEPCENAWLEFCNAERALRA